MTRRRRPRPRKNPQIDTSEEVAGTPLRRSPRLQPQIHASEDGVGIIRRIRRRRGKSPAALESLPLNEDMLREILLRLPPRPSSLLRASAVCKHWRGLVTDPRFLRRFRARQGKPPLVGVFVLRAQGIEFIPTLGPPGRISSKRFDLGRQTGSCGRKNLLGCRHGRALLLDVDRHNVIVCDPITAEHHRVAAPPVFGGLYIYGAVLCAAADQGHVHGSCHTSPFKVVLMTLGRGGDEYEYDGEDEHGHTPPIACVYSSETGLWGNVISTSDRCELAVTNPGVLIGNVLYWSSKSVNTDTHILDLNDFTDDILEFDLDRQSLAVIKGPSCLHGSVIHQIIQAEEGAVGIVMFLHPTFEVRHRKVNCHGGTAWLLQNTFEVNTVLGLPPQIDGSMRERRKYWGMMRITVRLFYLWTYMVHLVSMQFRKLDGSLDASKCHPFTSFYAPGVAIPGGYDGLEILHDK